MAKYFVNENFISRATFENCVSQFIVNMGENFCEGGIMKLP